MSQIVEQIFSLSDDGRLSLRSLTSGDYDRYKVFQHRVAQETQNTLQTPGLIPSQEILTQRWESALHNDSVETFIGCFKQEALIGFAGLHAERANCP